MEVLKNISDREDILVADRFLYQGYRQSIFLYKAPSVSNLDYYYLRLKLFKDREVIKQGYLYFYLNFEEKASQFIGLAIAEEYRNTHLSTLLLSSWIEFCFSQGFENLSTIQKQRKPFILYLLKKFRFDLENTEMYDRQRSLVISICKKEEEKTKYLLFHNDDYQRQFTSSKIMKSDNYQIAEKDSSNIEVLDDILLLKSYYLKEKEKAYEKSIGIYRSHR